MDLSCQSTRKDKRKKEGKKARIKMVAISTLVMIGKATFGAGELEKADG